MTGRKTIDVGYVLQRANAYLRLSPDETIEGRKAISGLIEGVLMESGNYKGFRYIKSTFDEHGIYQDHETVRFNPETTDETRRQYYVARNLGGHAD